ncbi:hypothetical protein PPYR_02549 [Photinus pyralis]|uniref:ornithine decarboxylase n=1 Tax=Photinus pyralis TaxID=7054 RepID=A0A5N4B7J7_PHOPY|nr:ornithine decarboxylase 2-like isoform X1 [Photinus pyralis]KAB0805579.1 hypothetical protein PPYR_02549 [Photinus pyralis]
MNYKRDLVNIEEDVNVRSAIADIVKSESEDCPTFVCNVDDIIAKHELWRKLMPRIEPHYAVKCNDSDIVLRTIAALGLGFDCASKVEIERVLSIGVDPSKIIFAHTVKFDNHIKYAVENNVTLMTFDTEHELRKMKATAPCVRAVIRIRYDSNAKVVLGTKFGCDPYTEAPGLLELAKSVGIDVVGVSFHVGSGSKDFVSFYNAIHSANHVFGIAKDLGLHFDLLDIGGGFPGKPSDSIETFAEHVNAAIEECFSDPKIRIISEPGMYFVESAFTLACSIYGVTESVVQDENVYNYFVSDGVFGNFTSVVSYDMDVLPEALRNDEGEKYLSVIRGPTTDAHDVIPRTFLLPKMKYGDYIIFHYMGSYTSVLTTPFNGFGESHYYYVVSKDNWCRLQSSKLPLPNSYCNLLCEKN